MITLDAFLVFLGAASLPAIYIFVVSRWVEPEYQQSYSHTTAGKPKSAVKREFAQQAA